jgi:hypothetical protein
VTDRGARAGRSCGVRLAVFVALALIGCGETSAETEIPAAREAPAKQVDVGFVPATHREGERAVLPLTFPNGTRATITYPHDLGIAELGVRPYGSAALRRESRDPERAGTVGRDFLILYDSGGETHVPNALRFEFGHWTVEVYDYVAGTPAAMTADERRTFQASLHGRETDDGFLVLEATPPLTLAQAGEHAGPALEFGMSRRAPWLLLFLNPCGPKAESTSRGFASWCLSDSIIAHAYGGRRFIAAAVAGIELR